MCRCFHGVSSWHHFAIHVIFCHNWRCEFTGDVCRVRQGNGATGAKEKPVVKWMSATQPRLDGLLHGQDPGPRCVVCTEFLKYADYTLPKILQCHVSLDEVLCSTPRIVRRDWELG